MARGFSSSGDIVRSTIDGVDLAALWREHQQAIDIRNRARDSFRAMLTFSTQAPGDAVAQTDLGGDFEDASEFGVPQSLSGPPTIVECGFNFTWRDLAARYTWRFLVEADAAQIADVHARALEADNRQVFRAVAGCLLNNAPRTNAEGLTVYPLYNADGFVPPEWNGQTFSGSHSHYLVSGAATFDGGDIRDAYNLVAEHGYGDPSVGGRIVVFMNPNESEAARGFKQEEGEVTKPHDFIPSAGTPAYLTTQTIVGDQAPNELGAINIFGSYGSAWLSESSLIPPGYIVAVAVYGPNDQRNPIAFREHRRSEYRGLLQIGGPSQDYPLQESYYQRGFGTGVRHRGGAAVVQVKASGSYDVPAAYTTVLA